MDIATIIGILSSIGLLVASMTMGVGIEAFLDPPSILIVCGGTACATMISYPLRDCLNTISVLKHAFVTQPVTIGEIIAGFTHFSARARKEGLLALEPSIRQVSDPFLRKGLQLTVDGLEPQAITEILERKSPFRNPATAWGPTFFRPWAISPRPLA